MVTSIVGGSESAAMQVYRSELIAEFEEGESWLRGCTTTEHMTEGNQVTFLVAGSGNASAVTRGINGLIPARTDNNNQYTATLQEWHDLVRKTKFNIFQSQGNQRALMQKTCRYVLNRRLDKDVIDIFDTTTKNLGAPEAISLMVPARAMTILGNQEVPTEDEDALFAVCTPACLGYLMQIPEFNSADYVDNKYLTGSSKRLRRWAGFNWIFHPRLTGTGSASEKCYFLHKESVGSAFDMENLDTAIGYDKEHSYSFARASSFTAAVMLQQAGIVQFLHDGSGIS